VAATYRLLTGQAQIVDIRRKELKCPIGSLVSGLSGHAVSASAILPSEFDEGLRSIIDAHRQQSPKCQDTPTCSQQKLSKLIVSKCDPWSVELGHA
jgi:hypothetical protein